MRGLRSLIVLIVIAAGLGWFAFHESKVDTGSATKLDKVFPALQADKIDEVTVKAQSGEQTSVRKTPGGRWQETSPSTTDADETELSGITTNLASLEVQRVVDDHASNLKQYGLDPARVSVAFDQAGQKKQLLIGNKTPTGSDLYAKLPDNQRVFLIPSYLDVTFNRTAFDLRDKAVLKFDHDKASHILIQAADHAINFSKDGNDWRITSPIDARADFSAVENILSHLNTAQMKAVTANEATDLKEYGLDKPDVTVSVSSGSSQATLTIGKKAADGTYYAKDAARPIVFTVESSLVDDVKKTPDDYRLKDLFDARAFNTTHVEIVSNGQTVTLDKQGETWKESSPSKKNADAGKVSALITALSDTRATAFVDSAAGTGLDKPELTATLTFDENKHETVKFSKKGSDAYAQRSGDTGAAKIDPAALDGIVKALDAAK